MLWKSSVRIFSQNVFQDLLQNGKSFKEHLWNVRSMDHSFCRILALLFFFYFPEDPGYVLCMYW